MIKICDSHNDLLYKLKNDNDIKNYLGTLPKGIEKLFCAYFSYDNEKWASVEDIAKKFQSLKSFKNAIPSVENCWFVNEANLYDFIHCRPFCATLTHNTDNKLCGGALGNGDITILGGKVIRSFEKHNIFVDTAHMNEKSFWSFCNLSTKPLFNSHTGFNFFFTHKRNLSNSQIMEIVRSRGYIGLAMYPYFFSNYLITSNKFCEIICKFWDKFGTKTLGFGTDFNGIEVLPKDITNYNDLTKIAIKLKRMGASDEEVDSLFSGNLMHFMNSNSR